MVRAMTKITPSNAFFLLAKKGHSQETHA